MRPVYCLQVVVNGDVIMQQLRVLYMYDLPWSEVDMRSSVAWCISEKDQQVATIVQVERWS